MCTPPLFNGGFFMYYNESFYTSAKHLYSLKYQIIKIKVMKKIFLAVVVMFFSLTAFNQTYNQSSLFYNTNKTYLRFINNPTKGEINIQISNPYSEKYDLALYSLNGQKISEVSFDHPGGVSTKTMYISASVSGMYFLVAKTTEGQQSLKIFIQ